MYVIIALYSISAMLLSFKAQRNEADKASTFRPGDDEVVYWFYLKIRIEDRTNSFIVSGTSAGLDFGKILDFEKSLWDGLSKRQIAIGPFYDKNEAMNAKRLYKPDKNKVKEMPEGEIPATVHWFAITFEQSPRLRIYVIKRNPAQVQSGTENRFIDVYFEQLPNKLLSIGPFYDYNQAEEAKRMYRMNE